LALGVAGGAVVVGVAGGAAAGVELVLGFGAGQFGAGLGAVAGVWVKVDGFGG
jgi:hypothetical protein